MLGFHAHLSHVMSLNDRPLMELSQRVNWRRRKLRKLSNQLANHNLAWLVNEKIKKSFLVLILISYVVTIACWSRVKSTQLKYRFHYRKSFFSCSSIRSPVFGRDNNQDTKRNSIEMCFVCCDKLFPPPRSNFQSTGATRKHSNACDIETVWRAPKKILNEYAVLHSTGASGRLFYDRRN